MDQNDYFAPVKFSPEPMPEKPRSALPQIVAVAVVILIVIAGAILFILQQLSAIDNAKDTAFLLATTIPEAGVRTGDALAWRQLASFDWEVSADQPRPNIVLGEFNQDNVTDILMIDLAGNTDIIGLDGARTTVKEPKWQAVSTFISWDYDDNGVAELVPTAALYHYQPKAKGFVTVRGRQGG